MYITPLRHKCDDYLFTFSQLADAFISSDLQMMTIEAIKTNKRAIICKCLTLTAEDIIQNYNRSAFICDHFYFCEMQKTVNVCFRHIYSGYGKYSDPLTFFTLLYCSHLLKSFKFIFFLINVHTAPHIDRKTQNCLHFCRFIKN